MKRLPLYFNKLIMKIGMTSVLRKLIPNIPTRYQARKIATENGYRDTFCIYAWNNILIRQTGEFGICCRALDGFSDDGQIYSIYTHSLEESWNSAYMRKVREKMLDGERIRTCNTCYMHESTTGTSMRKAGNSAWLERTTTKNFDTEVSALRLQALGREYYCDHPEKYQLFFGNQCNYKCRMCSPVASSRVARDQVHRSWAEVPNLINSINLLPAPINGVEYHGCLGQEKIGSKTVMVIDEVVHVTIPITSRAPEKLQVSFYCDTPVTVAISVSVNKQFFYKDKTTFKKWQLTFDFKGTNIEQQRYLQLTINVGQVMEKTQNSGCIYRSKPAEKIAIDKLIVYGAAPKDMLDTRPFFSNLKNGVYWWESDEVLFDQILESDNNIRLIDFAGGEPLLNKKFVPFLKRMIDDGRSKDIMLVINTNGSINSRSVLGLLEHFRWTGVSLSIDSYGKMNEYLRYGSNWDTIVNSIKRYRGLKNVKLEIQPTLTAYNIFGLIELLRYCHRNQLDYHLGNILLGPVRISINVLPDTCKHEALKRWQMFYELECETDKQKQHVSLIISAIKNANAAKQNKIYKDFIAFTNDLDADRDESLRDVDSDLFKYLENSEYGWSDSYRYK